MHHEPTDWEKAPQSNGFTFEGTIERLRYAASSPRGSSRVNTRLTLGFKVLIAGAVCCVLVIAAIWG